jgi:hypothetical protein
MLSVDSKPVGNPQRNRMLLTFGFLFTIPPVEHRSYISFCYSRKTKGLNVSQTGISVKTSKRFDHEEYMEATRRCVLFLSHLLSSSKPLIRGLVKVAAASTFGKAENATTHDSPKMNRVSSDSSSISSQEKKKKGLFRLRK